MRTIEYRSKCPWCAHLTDSPTELGQHVRAAHLEEAPNFFRNEHSDRDAAIEMFREGLIKLVEK